MSNVGSMPFQVEVAFSTNMTTGGVGHIAHNRRDDLCDLLNLNDENGISNWHYWARRLLSS